MLVQIEQFVNWVRRRNLEARTLKDYGYDLRFFVEVVGDRPPSEITFRDVDQLVSVQSKRGFKATTVNRRLAAIGDIFRFESSGHLVSYSGLVPGLEQSGVKLRDESITREGRKDLRWVMVEVAQRAVKSDPLWRQRFNALQRRMHRNRAIVAIARRLLELVWHVLHRMQPYRHFSQECIAYKYLTWSWQLNEATVCHFYCSF